MEAPNIKEFSPKTALKKYDKSQLLSFWETMVKIRRFEQIVEEKFMAGEIPGFVHLYIGEEAIATGVMANMTHNDCIESTHRGHGHTIAKGADLNRMMAEIFGKKTGCCKGKGGSMHIADFSVGMLGANGVVGGGYNLAAGAALAQKMQKRKDISAVFFGDGASNRGTFHEAANMASVWKLPLLFVCEMNEFASTTPYLTATSVADISRRAYGYDMPALIVDGNDVFSVYEGAKVLIEHIRSGKGPAFIECKTYRVKGHYVGDPEKYRTRDEVQKNIDERDPLKKFEEKVLEAKVLKKKDLDEVCSKVEGMLEDALKFARESAEPDVSELFTEVFK